MKHTHPTRLVQKILGQWVRTDFDERTDIIAAMELRGFKFTGLNTNHRQRAELQGAPVFSNAYGPMWDGDAIRYEDATANEEITA